MIKLVADFALPAGGLPEQNDGTRRLPCGGFDKSLAMEQHIELAEGLYLAKRLQREMFIGTLGGIALVESEADHVGDDAPTARGRRVDERVPALIDGGSTVESIAVEMSFRAF